MPYLPLLALLAAQLAAPPPPAAALATVPSATVPPATVPPAATPPPAVPAPRPATVEATLVTSMGTIVIALEKARAPVTTANFLAYVDGRRLDGASFYRATKVAEGAGLIQGGVQNDPKRVLRPIAHEPTTRTGLTHDDGAVSMAMAAPGTATGDFFITIGAFPTMDADPAAPDKAGFAVFGHVVAGMDVVRAILSAPTSPTAGEGAMKGQLLVAPVRILSARRTPPAG